MNSTPDNPDEQVPTDQPAPMEPSEPEIPLSEPEPPAEPDAEPEPPAEPVAPPPAPGPVVPPPPDSGVYPGQPAFDPPGTVPPAGYPGGPGAAPAKTGPGVWAGVATGCGLQVLGVLIFLSLIGVGTNLFGWLWPFIVIPAAAALLLIFKSWRRFATGILIVSAAMWIVVLGPCLALLTSPM